MKFVSVPELNHTELKTGRGTIYYRGSCSMEWKELGRLLDREQFPEHIRGSFGFIYINTDF